MSAHQTFLGAPLRYTMVSLTAAGVVITSMSTGRAARAGTGAGPLVGDWPAAHAACRPVSLRQVKLSGFLGAHVDANNRVSLPAGLKSPIPAAFEAIERGQRPPDACKRLATDSDFFKWLEGACYAIAYDPTLTELAAAVDRYATMLAALQEPEGFLGTRISPREPFDAKTAHDLYCAGHFIEAAVAHHKATGSPLLLDAARRLADFYIRAYKAGHPYFKQIDRREHPEIELALVRLYRATGDARYLAFSKTIADASSVGPTVAEIKAAGGLHAVRVGYLLTGLAEQYLETGEQDRLRYLPGLWDEIVTTRMYVTGGLGYEERIPAAPYDLPQWLPDHNSRDIAETCASVAFMIFSWRLHGVTGKARYFDAIERILYNHYLGAIAQDHLANFYYNPLRVVGPLGDKTDHGGNPVQRMRLPEIHSTACCLPNSWRFFGQLPEYVFSRRTRDGALLVNLYTSATAEIVVGRETRVKVLMDTRYPHAGDVTIRVEPARPVEFVLGLRIPGWCASATVAVNDERPAAATAGRYHELRREWHGGDTIAERMDMRPVVVVTPPEVVANRGQVAFCRGPLVYCLEQEDAGGLPLEDAVVCLDPEDPAGSVTVAPDPAQPFDVLRVRIGRRRGARDDALYRSATTLVPADVRPAALIPFYFRANRGPDPRWTTFLPWAPCR